MLITRPLLHVTLAAIGVSGCNGAVETSTVMPPCGSTCDLAVEVWSPASTLVTARSDHATFVADTPAGAFLYVAGGEVDSPTPGLPDVERAAIHKDGTLGAFSSVAKLPAFIDAAGLVQVGRAVVLAGGRDSISMSQTFVGLVADDGSVAFTAGPPLGTVRDHLTLSYHGGFVYAVGGRHQVYDSMMENTIVTLSDVVERAPFDGETLGPFEALAPLPMTLGFHGGLVVGDAQYLLGGTSDTSGPDVERAQILRAPFTADGKLGAFTMAGAFVAPRQGFATFVASGHAFALAGEEGSDDVRRAPLRADGTLGAFTELPSLPAARAHVHQTPVHGSFVYVAGGSLDNLPRGEVFAGRLSPPPP